MSIVLKVEWFLYNYVQMDLSEKNTTRRTQGAWKRGGGFGSDGPRPGDDHWNRSRTTRKILERVRKENENESAPAHVTESATTNDPSIFHSIVTIFTGVVQTKSKKRKSCRV